MSKNPEITITMRDGKEIKLELYPDSAGSQFFIVHRDSPHLDGKYAAFGDVIEGMDTVDQIAEVDTGARDMPGEDQIMESVEVDTFGEDYGAAERI